MCSARVTKIAACLIVIACLPLTAGCLGLPAAYAYPTINRFYALDTQVAGSEVEAFLVSTEHAYQQPGMLTTPLRYEVVHLPPSAGSCAVACTHVGYETFVGFISPLSYGRSSERRAQVVLYRRGYQLVKIQAWQKKKAIDWRPAESALEQKRVLDELAVAVPFSPDQLAEKRFLADEYERLAKLSEDGEGLRVEAASLPEPQ